MSRHLQLWFQTKRPSLCFTLVLLNKGYDENVKSTKNGKKMPYKYLILLITLALSISSQGQNINKLKEIKMNNTANKYGIEGYQVPEFNVPIWIDGKGNKMEPVTLEASSEKFRVIYCF